MERAAGLPLRSGEGSLTSDYSLCKVKLFKVNITLHFAVESFTLPYVLLVVIPPYPHLLLLEVVAFYAFWHEKVRV